MGWDHLWCGEEVALLSDMCIKGADKVGDIVVVIGTEGFPDSDDFALRQRAYSDYLE